MQVELRNLRGRNHPMRVTLVIGVGLIFSIMLCLARPVQLGLDYHRFADQRTIWGIPHGLDVTSNAPFVLAGVMGIVYLARRTARTSFLESRERIPYLVFFAGAALTGIGSAYYHYDPQNSRLVWDLLPMTLCFMSLLDAAIVERISVKAGLWLLWPFLALGIASVLYWYAGGRGDLRFYLFVQFFPALPIAMMIALFPPRYTRTTDLFVAFILFGLAKLFELFDRPIYSAGHIISGHALKHVTAGVSCYWILHMLQHRRGEPRRETRPDAATVVPGMPFQFRSSRGQH